MNGVAALNRVALCSYNLASPTSDYSGCRGHEEESLARKNYVYENPRPERTPIIHGRLYRAQSQAIFRNHLPAARLVHFITRGR